MYTICVVTVLVYCQQGRAADAKCRKRGMLLVVYSVVQCYQPELARKEYPIGVGAEAACAGV